MGIEIAKKEQKLGIRASSTCSLNFEDLQVPEENVIGGEGRGYKVIILHAKHLLDSEEVHRLPSRS